MHCNVFYIFTTLNDGFDDKTIHLATEANIKIHKRLAVLADSSERFARYSPPNGSFEDCAKCGKKFTVVRIVE